MSKTNTKYEEINLNGYIIHIFKDKVKIYNHKNIGFEEFKPISNKLVNYLIAEAFIDSKDKIKVEIATIKKPDTSTNN